MRWLRPTRLSLARKISLLFGTAVLLIIAVTLCFPWLQMTALNEQVLLVRAQRAASMALQAVDLLGQDWKTAQAQLDELWPVLSRAHGLPINPPKLVRAGGRMGLGFQSAAMNRLTRNRSQRYFWRTQEEGHLFRFAMAIRGTATDVHEGRVRGIIDVRLPVPSVTGAWNAVVTGLAGASGAMLAILVFYMVSQRIVLNPVRTLREVAEEVTTGNVHVRSDIHTGDEFEDLSDAVNDMLTHINAAQMEQEKVNRSLDIRLGELAETNIGLYESNRLKSEFLANVTHELRTPLVSIIGFAELLRDAVERPEPDRKRIARYADNILTSGRSLLEIINDLLDLAKIEAGKLELHVTEFSIAALCEDLIDFVHPLADKRNQRLKLESEPNLPQCRSDAGKIKQILYNLLSNAIKFTPTGGDITLVVGCASEDSIRLTVRDTGPGVPESQREAIFEKFRQLDSSRTREHEGTGLGLAITRDLVGVLGGTIALETAEGQGSAFSVDIPIVVHETVSQLRVRLP